MLSNENKNRILKYYGGRYKIIFAGDIKYQLPFIKSKDVEEIQTEFNKDGIDHVMSFSVDYRAKCKMLQDLKQECRNLIDKGYFLTPESLFSKLERCSNIENVYGIEDMILCQFHKNKDEYTEQFTGKFNKEKYYITETTYKYSCGDIIITDESIGKEFKPEVRHSFTVHSIQGETCKTKLFIHKAKMTLRMFYTAVSRAQYLNQIYLVY
jgi:hypothetical protein